ncbi:putative uncharacterized protein [Parachlamydia acanthamoebae UV-7]|uniref:Rhodanese domain-containing protein n=2 Tax=Parachlamydia acanthamoebae TaxID=83552 RepID=F8KVU3_PARAV|nr:MBL fold metallo-hydrolase [Parachlamydia acanthamoebae]EFB42148.1 hypothetical protein pah_c014o062 [Parachlamydia acanthamoebae str. Hall's coccus]KIA76295.1 hypothetical protein DB43_AM00100 [Parachlamydia acanthamoebae]CCB85232.1 putative uncharacterized protein [Parachlamydia acanthamoebae UV-7]
MILKKITDPHLSIHTYLLIDADTLQAAVIDPTRNVEPLLSIIADGGVQVSYILETHVHADFVSGSKELKSRLQGMPTIVCSGLGEEEWQPRYADRLVMNDREMINLGNLTVQAWHVPGHTPEHLMWVVFEHDSPTAVFSGDFLLGGSLGRPDLLGPDKCLELAKQLYQSTFHVLTTLPMQINVYPAHGAGSFCGKNIADKNLIILEDEIHTNPHLRAQAETEWINQLLAEMPPPPRYFARLKQLNVKGADLIDSLTPLRVLDIQELHSSDLELVDLRNQEAFAQSFIKGSINIPFGSSFTKWAAEIVSADSPIVFISSDAETVTKALTCVRLVGLDHVMGYFLWNEQSLSPEMSDSFDLILPENIASSNIQQIIDVRTQEEWDQGYIAGALHIPLPLLAKELPLLSREKRIAMICGSGYRSSIAASLAKKRGFPHMASVHGGMQAWKKAHLPVEIPKN